PVLDGVIAFVALPNASRHEPRCARGSDHDETIKEGVVNRALETMALAKGLLIRRSTPGPVDLPEMKHKVAVFGRGRQIKGRAINRSLDLVAVIGQILWGKQEFELSDVRRRYF